MSCITHRAPAPPWKPWVGSKWARLAGAPGRVDRPIIYWLTLLEPEPNDSLRWRVIVQRPGSEEYELADNYMFPQRDVSYMRID